MRKIKHLTTFRPLNMAITKDLKQIRPNIFYRSKALNEVSDEDMKRLRDEFNIGYVLDFRGAKERDDKPDNKIEGIEYISLPLLSDKDSPLITKENRIEILKEKANQPGGVKQEVINFYKELVNDPMAIDGYIKAFDVLLNNKERKGILYHCTQGKDRTGLFSVYILAALGCSREVMMYNYMDYNRYNWFLRKLIAVAMTSRFFSIKMARALHYVLVVKREFINTALNEIKKNYGSLDKYLTNQLQLTPEKRKQLRKLYLRKIKD